MNLNNNIMLVVDVYS